MNYQNETIEQVTDLESETRLLEIQEQSSSHHQTHHSAPHQDSNTPLRQFTRLGASIGPMGGPW